jgi:Protein of unknown function (DUF3618)
MSSSVEPHEPRDDGADRSALQADKTAETPAMAHDIPADGSRQSTPGNEQELRVQIDKTREHLGKTVEQLAAKADIKSRARVKAKDLASRPRGQAAAAAIVVLAIGAALWWRRRR